MRLIFSFLSILLWSSTSSPAQAFLLINADQDRYRIELTIGADEPLVEEFILEPGELVEYDCESFCILHLQEGVTHRLYKNDVLIILNGDIMIQTKPKTTVPHT